MITRKSIMREIDFVKDLLAQHSNHAIHQETLHEQIDAYFQQLDSCLFSLNDEISKLWTFVKNLDSVEHELDSKLYLLECKTEFLDHNKDALNMWIECVRQTQKLYEDSQKAEVTE